MARPERHDVDYFPFFVKDGRTLFILESKYGLEGDGFFTNLFRFLSQQPDHHFCIADPSDREYFFARCHCPDIEKGMAMLEIMATTGKIDKELWTKCQAIASADFLESIKDAYKDRRNTIITMDDIKALYFVSRGEKPVSREANPLSRSLNERQTQKNDDFQGGNPHTKLKDTKGEDIKKASAPASPAPASKPEPEEKKVAALGKFLNVILSSDDYTSLLDDYGMDVTDDYIDRLSIGIEKKGYAYKSHYAAIVDWIAKDKAKDARQEVDYRDFTGSRAESDDTRVSPEAAKAITDGLKKRIGLSRVAQVVR